MASIKDIAKACGVSVATVSKALNGHNDISQATKEKVREAARQIGYMPNSAARALKTNRTYNLGVLFVDEAQSGLTHEFFAAVLDSFKRHAEGRGYDITFINHNIGHGHSSYLEHCRYRGVDGVIAACIKFDDPEVIELAYSNLPVGGQLRGHDLRDQVAIIAGHRNIPRNQKSFLPDRLDAADGGEVIREEDRRGALRQCQQLTGRSGAAFRIAVGARHDVGIRHRDPMGGAGAVETDQTLLGDCAVILTVDISDSLMPQRGKLIH